MITDYTGICIICGRPKQHSHHLIGGSANRAKAEKYGLTIPLCVECHDFIHRNTKAHTLCHIIGQLYFEGKYTDKEAARKVFRKEFGKSWI